jgi:hypothetical protein
MSRYLRCHSNDGGFILDESSGDISCKGRNVPKGGCQKSMRSGQFTPECLVNSYKEKDPKFREICSCCGQELPYC